MCVCVGGWGSAPVLGRDILPYAYILSLPSLHSVHRLFLRQKVLGPLVGLCRMSPKACRVKQELPRPFLSPPARTPPILPFWGWKGEDAAASLAWLHSGGKWRQEREKFVF